MQLAEIAIDSDHEYYLQNGGSVTETVAQIERVMNRVDAIFERDTQVRFQITSIVVRTGASDPYSGLDLLGRLNQFRSQWVSNFAAVRRDVAHLFTGVAHDDWAIGYAWIGVVCNRDWGYGISERFMGLLRSSALTAHEIGHNFSANHCDGNGDCQVMCSTISGCSGGLNLFGQASADVIRDYAQARPCLLDVAPPLSLPIDEDFSSMQLDRSLWASPQGVLISDLGVNEPSAPYSLELDSAGSGPLDGDQVITNKILLSKGSSATLRVATQHRGAPAGVELEVAVWGDDRVWRELGAIVSDGVDQASYVLHEFALPVGAFHDEAKVRLRVLGGLPGQLWFVDDFSIQLDCELPELYCAATPNSVSPNGASLAVVGSTSLAVNDLALLAYDCPSSSTGIFLLGDSQQQLPVGNGVLCVAGSPIYRLAISQADPLGLNTLALDFHSLPAGLQPSVGDQWNVQLWFRDSVGALSNLSDAIQLTICP
ncbi:M12 family metallo-peptidase [bacterium]|nr:M12 family metallo-peptidase [bacterium]